MNNILYVVKYSTYFSVSSYPHTRHTNIGDTPVRQSKPYIRTATKQTTSTYYNYDI